MSIVEIIIKQISSLHKVRKTAKQDFTEIQNKTALAGERFSYQLYLKAEKPLFASVSVESELAENIRIYCVKDAVMDTPVVGDTPIEDYITQEPGLMPDILVPIEESGSRLSVDEIPRTLWVKVDIPANTKPGRYSVCVNLCFVHPGNDPVGDYCQRMDIEVLPVVMPEQKLIYTRWIYLDCIAQVHGAQIFSELHWDLIDQYIAAAADLGINMILVPVHTPPLDTEIGTARPCVQLVDIEKAGDTYTFDFTRFRRYISICKKHGIHYYEIAHMFSQWGAKSAPNIMVSENGKAEYRFGWHVAANDSEYISFLKQYIVAIYCALEKEGISENTYFHISDEPSLDSMQAYKTAAEIIRPLIGNSKTYDAISDYAFYEKGLIECPVTSIHHIHTFLQHDIPNQWLYYCSSPQTVYSNVFLAMPSYRTRILGFLLYKYNIKGFLHWGFNFYNACRSIYAINPYVTTSGDGAWPSGDPFIVYPGKNCVYTSIRGEMTYEAVQDMNTCFALEGVIGRDKVVQMIDEAAGGNLRFDAYPQNNEFIEALRQKMIQRIAQ